MQDRLASTNPPEAALVEVAERLEELSTLLEPWVVPEGEQIAGTRIDLPSRGLSLLPPFVVDDATEDTVTGHVVFRRFYLGGNGAAHGGALPLFFDELLGHLANSGERPRARTAYLHVNYRHITPIEVELRFDANVHRIDGRKRWVTGRIHDGDTLVSDAEGLFVTLLPGQP
ncbi:MAG: PaaI family thioesterase [Acidobacteria bacterium]|nr:PaaI family thioesterase [Acidobacteriota bacterium]